MVAKKVAVIESFVYVCLNALSVVSFVRQRTMLVVWYAEVGGSALVVGVGLPLGRLCPFFHPPARRLMNVPQTASTVRAEVRASVEHVLINLILYMALFYDQVARKPGEVSLAYRCHLGPRSQYE